MDTTKGITGGVREHSGSCVAPIRRVLEFCIVPALIGASLLLASCSGGGTSDGTKTLEILWTNDTHGYFVPMYHAEYYEVDSYAQTAATEGTVGGYARIAAMVKDLKSKSSDVVFVDGGDTFDGSPVAQMTQGAAVIPILNAMGYDAMVPGNRDFGWNKETFLALTKGGTTTGALNNGIASPGITTPGIKFPVVAANLLDADTLQLIFPPYTITKTTNLKVAFIGMTSPLAGGTRKANGSQGFLVLGQTPQTATVAAGANVPAGFQVEDQISALAAQIRQTERPDLVVVISHMGYFQDRKFASRSTGIDVIVGAHTHHNITDAPTIPNKDGSISVVVVQAGSHGKYLGKLDLQVKDAKVTGYANALLRINAANAPVPDPTIQAMADAAYAPFKAQFDRVVGYTTVPIIRRGDVQSTMGNFLADVVAGIFGTELSSASGIRYGSTIPGSVAKPGPITYGDIMNVVSTNSGGNAMYVRTMTGAAIVTSINNGLNQEYGTDIYNWGGGDVTRYTKNVKYTFNITAANNAHIVNLSVIDKDGVVVPMVVNGVNNSANQARVFTYAGTSGALTEMVASPLTAVDQIAAYIQRLPGATVSPKIDDRAVCLDKAAQPSTPLQSAAAQCPGPNGT